MAILGIVIAQISRIQHHLRPNHEYKIRYYVLGKPQACICQISALLILLAGTYRFFRQQNEITQGRARVGGPELHSVWILIFLCLSTFFLLVLLVDIAEVYA